MCCCCTVNTALWCCCLSVNVSAHEIKTCLFPQSLTSMTVASHVRGTHRERVFPRSESLLFCLDCYFLVSNTENNTSFLHFRFTDWNESASREMHKPLVTHHSSVQIITWLIFPFVIFITSNRKMPNQSEYVDKNTNHSHRGWLVVSQLGCRNCDVLLLTSCWLYPLPRPGLRWVVFLFCSTRGTGWAPESEPVLRTSLQPALTLISCWRNTATERWESTVSKASGTRYWKKCL